MTKISGPIKVGLFNVVIIGVVALTMTMGVTSQGNSNNSIQTNGTYAGNIVLNIYIDEGGKALITGYADDIDGLPFLKGSQYKYDKGTKQLYALTNSLTDKSGDDWETKLPSFGNYSEYHSIFYLPASVRISKIGSTSGLEYLVSAANDSFQVDFHGYDIKSPTITIDYQIPLIESTTSGVTNAGQLKPLGALLGLALASGALIFWLRRRSTARSSREGHQLEDSKNPTGKPLVNVEESSGGSDEADSISQITKENRQAISNGSFVMDDDNKISTKIQTVSLESISAELKDDLIESGKKSFKPNTDQYEAEKDVHESIERIEPNQVGGESIDIQITSEMAAVMETLTARERAVLNALIEHNGKMNQADIRYETSIPKSSLTGILLSLERRKLITKKERGRTNAVELSDWFLSKNDSSGLGNN